MLRSCVESSQSLVALKYCKFIVTHSSLTTPPLCHHLVREFSGLIWTSAQIYHWRLRSSASAGNANQVLLSIWKTKKKIEEFAPSCSNHFCVLLIQSLSWDAKCMFIITIMDIIEIEVSLQLFNSVYISAFSFISHGSPFICPDEIVFYFLLNFSTSSNKAKICKFTRRSV